jgi:hypothetical protein
MVVGALRMAGDWALARTLRARTGSSSGASTTNGRCEYHLMEKGEAFYPVLLALRAWSRLSSIGIESLLFFRCQEAILSGAAVDDRAVTDIKSLGTASS